MRQRLGWTDEEVIAVARMRSDGSFYPPLTSVAFERAAQVEAKLLAGCNRLVVLDKFAGVTTCRTVYEVPRWRDKPIARLKVERLRRRYRRGSR